jgi:DNA-binding NtrC family response regulator
VSSNDILIVDDEIGIRELLSEILQDEGFNVAVAENAEAARLYRNQKQPRLVLLDIWMPDTDGVTLLKEWARNGQLTMPVIMMSGHATIDTAVEATKIGALDFLEKPIGLQKLLAAIKRALQYQNEQPIIEPSLSALGNHIVIQELKSQLDKIADKSTVPLLLSGEPGCGYESCARYLTPLNAPFISPLSNDDIASSSAELIVRAAGGTLFIREIAHLESKAQAGLAFIMARLEKNKIRLICATSVHLQEVARRFSAQDWHILSQLVITLPTLREHREDIPLLAERYLLQQVVSNRLGPRRLTQAALNVLSRHDWPGNIDQLNNLMRSLALTSKDGDIDAPPIVRILAQFTNKDEHAYEKDLHDHKILPQFNFDLPLREARDQFEKFYLERHIELANGNMSRVAEKIGLERTHLYRKLKQLGIQMPKKKFST